MKIQENNTRTATHMTTPQALHQPSEQSCSDDGECKKCLPLITELQIQIETKINEVNQLKHVILSQYGSQQNLLEEEGAD